ncbi:MAG: PEGA domain-containing protein [Acidobacteria bacterium]|nr:PEGA domain-containing protein [Acidobacteriota bacterium]
MQCPECKGDVPPNNFYCPHCRAELPWEATGELMAAADKAAKSDRKERAERAAALRRKGPRLHSRKLFEIGWQAMQWMVVIGVFAGAFVAYKRVNWQSAATRVNDVASAVRPVEAAGTSAKPAQRNAITASSKKSASEKGQPLALQPTATAGLLIVKSPAAIARIFVNGKFAGNTPHSFAVSAGEHQLRLEAEGYQVWTRTVVIRGNQQIGILAELEK